MFNVLVLHYHFEGNFCLVSVLNYAIKNVIIIQHHSFQWSFFLDGTVQTMVNISSGQEYLKIAFVNCLREAKKQVYFNYWSGDKDSANTDLEKEIKDEGNCSEKTTEESEIRAEWSADHKSRHFIITKLLWNVLFELQLNWYCIWIYTWWLQPYFKERSKYLKCNYPEMNLRRKVVFFTKC